jgi:hypothetical protein
VVEEALAVDVLEGGPALGRGAQQPGRCRPVQLAARQGRPALRTRNPVAQALPDRGQGEAPVAVLGEHVLDDEPAQDAPEHVGVGADGLGDLARRPRPIGQDVGHAEPRRHVEQLRGQVAVDQPR